MSKLTSSQDPGNQNECSLVIPLLAQNFIKNKRPGISNSFTDEQQSDMLEQMLLYNYNFCPACAFLSMICLASCPDLMLTELAIGDWGPASGSRWQLEW